MPRISSSGSFAGVYGIGLAASSSSEEADYVGAVMTFAQTSAPTGWTKITTYDDAIVKVGLTNVTSGGTNGFSSTFNYKTLSGSATVAGGASAATLGAPQLPPHTHDFWVFPSSAVAARGGPSASPLAALASTTGLNDLTTPTAGLGITGAPVTSVAHTHPAGTAGSPTTYFTRDMAIKYIDVIIASKD